MMGLFQGFYIFFTSENMRVEKKYTHRVIIILLLIGVLGRTVYGAIRAAWNPIQQATLCEYPSVIYPHDFDHFLANNQPPVWDIVFNLPQFFLLALALVIPIYISYLISRRFVMASFVFKAYLLWYVSFSFVLLDVKDIVAANCHRGSAYIGFVVMDLFAFFLVPAVVVFLIFVEAFVLGMEKRSLMAQKEKSEAESDS